MAGLPLERRRGRDGVLRLLGLRRLERTPPCEDALSGPDVVPCASSSGPGLSMLAPGVGWTTTAAGGGRTAIFSGTSASAPAATGAVLLTRQARPLADPALAFDLLRATGVPVLDNRTGRITPRLDLSAALSATTPIGSCGGAAIPDGTGETLVCEVFVSALRAACPRWPSRCRSTIPTWRSSSCR